MLAAECALQAGRWQLPKEEAAGVRGEAVLLAPPALKMRAGGG